MVTLRGSGLAAFAAFFQRSAATDRARFDIVTANDQPVGWVSISPTTITIVMPWATAGAGKIRLKATVGCANRNQITVRASPAAVGYFVTTENGLGTTLAAPIDGAAIGSASPAAADETISALRFRARVAGECGPEYDWPSTAEPASVPVQAGGVQATVLSATAAPGLPGVYQINLVIPPGATTSAGANVRIFEGYAQTHPKVTIAIK
ncbi:MAG: hypothetical protein JST11_30210 [Acidobacteria bacterium]|nr:hypothetical protein [Acidobacteriota bacterium]